MTEIQCKDGSRLFYKTSGKGQPIILIAGGFCDHHVWEDLITLLNPYYQVITYDNRGIGRSSVTDNEYTIELLASDLSDLLDKLNIRSAHIVGHSMGGFVAQYFAAYYPHKIISLSLLSSLLVMNKAGIDYLDMIIQGMENQPDKIRQNMPEKAGQQQEIKSIIQQATLCKIYDARSYIHKIHTPTLIVSGLKETVVTKEESNYLSSAIRNVKSKIFLNCDHMLQREKPHELAKACLDFLRYKPALN